MKLFSFSYKTWLSLTIWYTKYNKKLAIISVINQGRIKWIINQIYLLILLELLEYAFG